MDKLKDMDTQSLMMLASYLMIFPNAKTIRECHQDINNIITERVEKKEALKKAKVIYIKEWKEAKEKI